MSDLPPKAPEFLKRACASGQRPELVKETEWSYVYKLEDKSYYSISKFLTDETFTVSASVIRGRWPSWSESERLEFVHHFWSKPNWSANDTEILEIVMQYGNDRLWGQCALAFLKHPDRERAVRFLIQRLEKCDPEYETLNYIQALGILKDPRAAPAIQPHYEKYRTQMEAEKVTGVPDDVVFGPIPYSAYFTACGALLQITGSAEYEEGIRKYLDHPNEQVRYWAEHALEFEGPATAKRNAEYRKKYFSE
jgi:HEAT repeat protein